MTTEHLMNLHEYVCDLCVEKGICIDLRWGCFGDPNRFYHNNELFSVAWVHYYASNIEDVKSLIVMYIENTWEHRGPNNRVGLYIEDIVYMNGWYDVIIGGCSFKDMAFDT